MDPIYESYKETLNEEVFMAIFLTALATGTILKLIDKKKSSGPGFIDWLAGFIKWGMSDADEGIDIRDIKKYAYQGYVDYSAGEPVYENTLEESSSLSNKFKALQKKGGTAWNKTKGIILGKIIKYADMPKSTIDKVLKAAQS